LCLYSVSNSCRRSLSWSSYSIFSAPFSCRLMTLADMSGWEAITVVEFRSVAIAVAADRWLKVNLRDIAYCIQYTFKAFCKRQFCLLISFWHIYQDREARDLGVLLSDSLL
jgi:hypothetical protein